jgi:photosystem II stability/assembly factor-like uncharacterized protein
VIFGFNLRGTAMRLPPNSARAAVRFAGLALLAFGLLGTAAAETPVDKGPPALKHLKYRSVGPAAGGRVCRVTGVPGDPLVYYTATASGGVWKSSDGGLTWKPIFDDQPTATAGSIAVAASNPNILYVGSGETNLRGNIVAGNGIYKSGDAGKTWTHVWKQEGQIGTMAIHPTNADIAFAAVLGHAFGPNPERGIYRTTDGGKTWTQVLKKDADSGASDVCIDPTNPQVVFAGLWQARRKPWEMTSGGPGSGLYVSHDGGDTWKQLGPPAGGAGAEVEGPGKGLPAGPWGKVAVAVSPANSQRVFALIEAEKGGLYRSDDGGDNWRLVNGTPNLRQRAFYYMTLTLDPKNPDVVWAPQVQLLKSIDGGRTFNTVRGPHHGDHHDLWIDPTNPRRMINGNDGGLDVSTNGGESWYSPPLPISQFYHVAADNRVPYHVSGAMQDLGTASGPSNSLNAAGIARSDWRNVGGGEAGFTAPDPFNPEVIYAGEYGGVITRYDDKARASYDVSIYPAVAVGKGGEELKYRFQWTAPILASRHEAGVVYHGSNVLFKSSDGGKNWLAISGDLTRNDKSKQKWSGGPITGDNTGVEIYCTVFALAESPKDKTILWAGSDDGLVQLSRDSGKTWTNVTGNIKGLPEWGTISCIETSPFEAGTAYVVADAHRLDDSRPYLFKTTDFGQTWKSLVGNLPQDVCLHAVREDPRSEGLLFAGTDRGVAFSSDGGTNWQQLRLNLPTVPVHDLVVKEDDLVVGTHGRSIWILDDLTAVRGLTAKLAAEDMHFFAPRSVIQWHYYRAQPGAGVGANPPRGAVLTYYLKAKPKGALSLEVLDSQGKEVTKLSSKRETSSVPEEAAEALAEMGRRRGGKTRLTTEVGVNQVVWDMTYDGPSATVAGAVGWPPPLPLGPAILPGTYTLKLTAGGKTQTQSLTVNPDPRTKVQPAEREEQLRNALALRDDVARLAKIINQVRSLKEQITARNDLLKDNTKAEALVKLGKEMVEKLDSLEARLHNPKAKIPYDLLAQKGGAKLYSQLNNLYFLAIQSEGAPTQGLRESYSEQRRELYDLEGEFKTLTDGELARLNEMAKKLDLAGVLVPSGEGKKPMEEKP